MEQQDVSSPILENKKLTKLKIDMSECAADILSKNYLPTYIHAQDFFLFVLFFKQ